MYYYNVFNESTTTEKIITINNKMLCVVESLKTMHIIVAYRLLSETDVIISNELLVCGYKSACRMTLCCQPHEIYSK